MELILRCQAGDPNAFALLFDKYKNLVFRTALLMLNDAGEAEDALQEVFLRVYRFLPTYQSDKGAFTTWLHKITVNHCLNQLRKRSLPFLPLDLIHEKKNSMKDSLVLEQIDQNEDIRRGLQKLSPKLRAVLVLSFYWGLTYSEMAQALDIPIGTVQSRMNQALKNLRCSLDENPSGKKRDLDVSGERERNL
ncbi:sigma-70 family RNA polymerase sigma factor [archaeon]|nr:sigma-70 family RNA polymerase sigma factor [archaeon]